MFTPRIPRFNRSSRMPSCALSGLAFAGLIVFTAACKDDDGDDGVGDTGSIECPECAPDEDVYACVISGQERAFCFDSLEAARQSCGTAPGNGVIGNGPTTCDNQTADTNADWKPSSFVAYDVDAGCHRVDRAFFDDIRMNPDQLLYDGARLVWRRDHFEFETIEAGDLADALGFLSGDRLLSINGHPLTTIADAFTAFDAVYDEQAFVVEVMRELDIVVLRYELE